MSSVRDINIYDAIINLEDYKIGDQIGKGGFGIVFKANEIKTKKEVALKVLMQTQLLKSKKEQANLLREISVPRYLNLPGIVKLIGFRFPLTDAEKAEKQKKGINLKIAGMDKGKKIDVDLGGAIIITELMKNGSTDSLVSEYIKTSGKAKEKMNPTIRSKIIFGVAATMKRVHKHNIIHRDLKLENVFLDDNLEPRIADFGLAKVILEDVSQTMAVGTPYIMAPEIFMDGEENYGQPVDVYAFAFLIYKMFCNTLFFSDGKPARSSQQYMMKIGRGNRPRRPENIPDCYWELLQDCWAQEPEKRPTFDQITETLKDDRFAIEEYGMKTNLDQLHEYRARIDNNAKPPELKSKPISKTKVERKTKFIWTRH